MHGHVAAPALREAERVRQQRKVADSAGGFLAAAMIAGSLFVNFFWKECPILWKRKDA